MEFKNKQKANCGHKRISGKEKRFYLYISYAPTTRLAPVPFWLKAFLVPTSWLRLRTRRILRGKGKRKGGLLAVYDKETQNTAQIKKIRNQIKTSPCPPHLQLQSQGKTPWERGCYEPCNRSLSIRPSYGAKSTSLPFSLPFFPLSPETPDTQATVIA